MSNTIAFIDGSATCLGRWQSLPSMHVEAENLPKSAAWRESLFQTKWPSLAADTDDLICGLSSPPLSSISVASQRIGYEAAVMLHAMMRGEPCPSEPRLISPNCVIAKQSTDALAIDDAMITKAMRFIQTHAFQGIVVEDILREVPVSRTIFGTAIQTLFRPFAGRRDPSLCGSSGERNCFRNQNCRSRQSRMPVATRGPPSLASPSANASAKPRSHSVRISTEARLFQTRSQTRRKIPLR